MKKTILLLLLLIILDHPIKAEYVTEDYELNNAAFWYKCAFAQIPNITYDNTLPPIKGALHQNSRDLPNNDYIKYNRILSLFDSSLKINRFEMEEICKVDSVEKAMALSENNKILLNRLLSREFLGSIRKAKRMDYCFFYRKRDNYNDDNEPNVYEWGYKIRVIKALFWHLVYLKKYREAVTLIFDIFDMYDKMSKDKNDYVMLSSLVVKNNLLELLINFYTICDDADLKSTIASFIKDQSNINNGFKNFISVRQEYVLNSLNEFEKNHSQIKKLLEQKTKQYYLKNLACFNLRIYLESAFEGFLKTQNNYKEKNLDKINNDLLKSGFINGGIGCPNGGKFKVNYSIDELGCETANFTCDCDDSYGGNPSVDLETRTANIASYYMNNEYETHKRELLAIYDKLLNSDLTGEEFNHEFIPKNLNISKNNDLYIHFGFDIIAIKSAFDEYQKKCEDFCQKH